MNKVEDCSAGVKFPISFDISSCSGVSECEASKFQVKGKGKGKDKDKDKDVPLLN
jgi:hypothetical protein